MTIPVPNDIEVFERAQIRRNRDRAAKADGSHHFLADWAMGEITGRLDLVKRDFARVLQIGTLSARALPQEIGHELRVVSDMAHGTLRGRQDPARVQADEDMLPFSDHAFDLVLSPLCLHLVNDLPGALLQIRRVLKPDGLFIGAMLGGETLWQLRQCLMEAEMNVRGGFSPRVAPFADKPQCGALLQRAGFALPVVDSEIVSVSYEHAFRLMEDLRLMGEGNGIAGRDKRWPRRTLFAEAARLYQERFAESDGRIVATFEIIFLLGWAPHESQQKPLRPGSAAIRLADALQTDEIST